MSELLGRNGWDVTHGGRGYCLSLRRWSSCRELTSRHAIKPSSFAFSNDLAIRACSAWCGKFFSGVRKTSQAWKGKAELRARTQLVLGLFIGLESPSLTGRGY